MAEINWQKSKEEVWSREELVNTALDSLTLTIRGKKIIVRRMKKADEIEITKKCFKISPEGKIKDIDMMEYQLQVLEKVLVKPKLTREELMEMDAALFNEIFTAYQQAIGLTVEGQNL